MSILNKTFKLLGLIIWGPIIALIAAMDYNNGKTFKENYDLVSAKHTKVEGPTNYK